MNGHNSNAQLISIVERIEKLEEEKAATASDIKDVYAEAQGAGFDKKALREIVRRRKQDQDARDELEAVIDTYTRALGGLADTPLGKAGLENALRA